jgi:hypothetical protein
MSELDTIVETSLRSFYQDICSEWCGRENEIVNLYALGHLAKHVRPGTILSELTQIGIGHSPPASAPASWREMADSSQGFGDLACSSNDPVEGWEALSQDSVQLASGDHGMESESFP